MARARQGAIAGDGGGPSFRLAEPRRQRHRMATPPPGADGLLTLARKAYAAASDADAARLVDDLDALVRGLGQHLDHELPALVRLPPAEVRLFQRGQARVVAAAQELLDQAEAGCGGSGRCAARAEELLALLTLQSRDERLALHGSSTGAGWDRQWQL